MFKRLKMLWHKDLPCPNCGKDLNQHTKKEIIACLREVFDDSEGDIDEVTESF